MRNATDQQLREWGWKWALRREGQLVAVTLNPLDVSRWLEEKECEIVVLFRLEAS